MLKISISDLVRKFSKNLVAIGEDPSELISQIRPLLQKLELTTAVNNPKITLVPGQMQGNNSLYCVPIRRQFMLTPDHINRIKRNLTTLNYIQWNQVGMEIYFWWPYISPENAAKPQPKVVQAPPARPMGTPAVLPKS